MFKLDNDFLVSLGLGTLPVEEKNKLLQTIYERLELNVGMRLAERMTDAQLDEFEAFIDKNDETGALHWLETNFPNYKDVVAEELEKLKTEVSAVAPQILSAAQAAPAAPAADGSQAAPSPFMNPAAPAQPQSTPATDANQPPASQPTAPWDAPQQQSFPSQPPAGDTPNQQPPAGFSSQQ